MSKNIRDLGFVLFIMALMFSFALGGELHDAERPGYIVKIVTPIGKVFYEGKMREMQEEGTGSLIRHDLVLTANHVTKGLKEGRQIKVRFMGDIVLFGKVIRHNKEKDLCLLEIPSTLMPVIKISGNDPHLFQEVTSGGFAYGKEYQELTGMVLRWYELGEKQQGTAFSVMGGCVSGMSGGPAVANGKLMGILFGTDEEVSISMCPNAISINNFLKGLDLSEKSGILE